MPKYLSLFAYTGEAWSRMVAHPNDRTEAARKLIEDMGGTMECFYWMLGEHDGLVIYEAPDEATVAAIVGGVHASRLIAHIKARGKSWFATHAQVAEWCRDHA